ncbi:N-acetyltransferase [Actibacterium sp. 188UL27-1]|uniref:GNAT family N-acetyltransferase n=1 Tax=Actibacterium sp. 188UL27-1 TaxID=2786961 RepID=UPI00195E0EC3|nr:GNAT family N-acetyltransferase [Actibacterium sp. 188UL27-1]MBM7068418.1 GNAT family N-acetyltransferase [Actibacterium sp. 188UL27-1]
MATLRSRPGEFHKDCAAMQINLHSPALADLGARLHDHLAAAGQALREGDYRTILFSIREEDGGLTTGRRGEICRRSVHVSQLWVAEQHRGAGIASRLLARVEDRASQEQCDRIHLETRNEAARRLYEKQDYAVSGSLPNCDGTVPLYYLHKPLL